MTTLSNKPVIQVALNRLRIAPQNMRAGEEADDRIPDLAKTLLVGQIMPIFVYWDERSEIAYVVEGRRRYLAFCHLRDTGAIGDDFLVSAIVCETPEEVAAAAITANTSRASVSMADYLLSIHRLAQDFKTPEEIGSVLGLDPGEVRKLAKLGSLDERLLKLFKAGRTNLETLRKVSRITDHDTLNSVIATAVKNNGLESWQLRDMSSGNLYATTGIGSMVDLKEYAERGGHLETDLFGELAARLVDRDLAVEMWHESISSIVAELERQGVAVTVDVDSRDERPDGSAKLNDMFRPDIGWEESQKLRDKADAAGKKVADLVHGEDHFKFRKAVFSHVMAQLKREASNYSPLPTRHAVLRPSYGAGIGVKAFTGAADFAAHVSQKKAEGMGNDNQAQLEVSKTPRSRIRLDRTGLPPKRHQAAAMMSAQGLGLAVAGHAAAALDLQIAQQFAACMPYGQSPSVGLLHLRIRGRPYSPDSPLQKPIMDQLQVYIDEYLESGLHPLEFIYGLRLERKLCILALVTALQFDIYEQYDCGSGTQTAARATAAHLARIIAYDAGKLVKLDADFYAGYKKDRLLAFIGEMGEAYHPYAKLPTAQLAEKVAELGAAKNFVPAFFNFELDLQSADVVPEAAE